MKTKQELLQELNRFKNELEKIESKDNENINIVYWLNDLITDIKSWMDSELDVQTIETIEECRLFESAEMVEIILFEQRRIQDNGLGDVITYLRDMTPDVDWYYVDGYENFYDIDASVVNTYIDVIIDMIEDLD